MLMLHCKNFVLEVKVFHIHIFFATEPKEKVSDSRNVLKRLIFPDKQTRTTAETIMASSLNCFLSFALRTR